MKYKIPRVKPKLIRDGRAIPCTSPNAAAAIAKIVCCGSDPTVERMAVLHLDSKNKVRNVELIAQGGANSLQVKAPEVYKGAILAGANGIILAHNHPSGDVQPSPDDLAMTETIRDAGKIIGIPLRDHIIVSDGLGYYSMIAAKDLETE